jgi:signal transduction histidine kinase
MIDLAANDRTALELVERVSCAGQSGVAAPVLLERICSALTEAFEFSSVAAMRYDPEAEEVSEIAFAGVRTADRVERQPISRAPVLTKARATRKLVLVATGGLTSAFVLPLVSGERCLGFLSGSCPTWVYPLEIEKATLATIGVVAATLLDDALQREQAQELDVRKSEFIALAAHELRNPLSNIYGLSIVLTEQEDALTRPERLKLWRALRETVDADA